MAVEVGSQAPDFTLPSVGGESRKEVSSITLSAYRGKSNVLLAFYPADFTPVCTSEMQCFADDWTVFRTMGCEILGISTDPIEKHLQFTEQLKLDFPLLSDPQKQVTKLYDVDSLLGTRRAYFIVDMDGMVRYKHVEVLPFFKRDNGDLLNALRDLKQA